jgi:hypothetical protein
VATFVVCTSGPRKSSSLLRLRRAHGDVSVGDDCGEVAEVMGRVLWQSTTFEYAQDYASLALRLLLERILDFSFRAW